MTPAYRLWGRCAPWLLLVLAALLFGCGDAFKNFGEKKDDKKPQEEELVPVEVASLALGEIEAVLRFSTNLEAESKVEVFSQASRQVTKLLVEEGERVREGQLLVHLQDDAQKSALARTESQIAKARREYERQKKLFAQELISEQAMNDATYEVDQLQLALDDAKRELSYTEVRAPIAGTVTARLVNLGDTVTVNQHLFDLVDFNTIVARVFVPEKDLARLRLDQTARLWSQALDGPRQGQIIRISPIVDPRSGTVKVTVGIPSNLGLRPGQYVEVELVVATRDDALLVPKRALVFDDTQVFVYRLGDDMRVERLEVVPDLEDRMNVVPSGDALSPGDRIVVAGQAGLKDGTKVRLAESDRGLPEAESGL